jgi:hypothetical protein
MMRVGGVDAVVLVEPQPGGRRCWRRNFIAVARWCRRQLLRQPRMGSFFEIESIWIVGDSDDAANKLDFYR